MCDLLQNVPECMDAHTQMKTINKYDKTHSAKSSVPQKETFDEVRNKQSQAKNLNKDAVEFGRGDGPLITRPTDGDGGIQREDTFDDEEDDDLSTASQETGRQSGFVEDSEDSEKSR